MLFLDARDIAALLDYRSCIAAVEAAFLQLGRGDTPPPVVCGVHVADGVFHIKAAALDGPVPCFLAKTNANFPGNPARHGLPTVQGLALLFDGSNGRVLCALDSGELTVRRTAAATAVAAKHLARPDSKTVTLVGCGVQGRAHVLALAEVLSISTVYAYDIDPAAADRLAVEMAGESGLEVRAVRTLADHARRSDVCVTCTTSRTPLLGAADVQAGSFIAGVGADNPEKSELAPGLLAGSRVVTDVTAQCAAMGDLRHAIAAGVMTRESVHAELWEVIAGRRPGRRAPGETFVFDSTGTALQDVAAAALVYERARAAGRGRELEPAPASATRAAS